MKTRMLVMLAVALLCAAFTTGAAAYYDDFNQGALDTGRWTVRSVSEEPTLHFTFPGQMGLQHYGNAELISTAVVGAEAVIEVALAGLETPGRTNFAFGLRDPKTGNLLYVRYNRNLRVYAAEHIGPAPNVLAELKEAVGNQRSHPPLKIRLQRNGNQYQASFALEGGAFSEPVSFSSDAIGAEANLYILLQGETSGTAWIDYVDYVTGTDDPAALEASRQSAAGQAPAPQDPVVIEGVATVSVSASDLARIPHVIHVSSGVERVYKTVNGSPLKLYIFAPEDRDPGEPLPAVLFFFGGGWVQGQPTQFVPQSHYLASRGIIGIPVDYRIRNRFPDATWFDAVADAKDAIRWVRQHADELGIDPDRIVASGGSAGGHLAAATALVDDSVVPGAIDGVSAMPNAMVLFNPAVDLTHFYDRFVDDPRWIENATSISPTHQVRGNAPPTLVQHGTADRTVPIRHAEQFCDAMRDAGNHCELEVYPGAAHGFFQYSKDDKSGFWAAVFRMDEFLTSLGYLPEKPEDEQ